MICTLLPVAVCRIQRLYPASDDTAWATYLPSDDTAATETLPVDVRRAIDIVSPGAAAGRRPTITYAPAIAARTAAAATAGTRNGRRVDGVAGRAAASSPDARS